MASVAMRFTLGARDYRRMMYFNTFALRRGQWLFVLLAWLASVTLLLLEIAGVITPTQIMHLCFLLVAVAAPMLVVIIEIRIGRFRKQSDIVGAQQTVLVKEDGVNYRHEHSHETGHDSWDELQAVYETKHMFVLYKDDRHTVVVPKDQLQPDACEKASRLFQENLGRRFKARL